MSESSVAIRKIMEDLGASNGGSLVKRVKKRTLDPKVSVLFVGLGGLGCETVNAIKAQYLKNFNQTPKIRFLAADTAQADLAGVTIDGNSKGEKEEEGTLSVSETFSIFTPAAITCVSKPAPEVEAWLGSVSRIELDATGAGATRQYGRAMLCGTPAYGALEAKISSILSDPSFFDRDAFDPNARLNVVVVAGISGGTGSGTFIDVSYMIRRLLSSMTADKKLQTKLWGAFYTPDVQLGESFAQADQSKAASLRRNGYAALKELDYFVNAPVSSDPANPLYSLVMPNRGRISCNENLFEIGRTFIINPSTGVSGCDNIRLATAKALLFMYEETTGRAPSSEYSNACDNIGVWLTEKVGKHPTMVDDTGKPAKVSDPCGNVGAKYPAFMKYAYSSIGYGALYVPRDELMAYCANAAFTSIYQKWHNIGYVTQDFIDASLQAVNLGSIESICKQLQYSLTGGDAENLFKTDDIKFGKFMGFGKYDEGSIDAAVGQAKSKVDGTLQAASLRMREYADTLLNSFIQNLESSGFEFQYGPFVGLVLLNGVHSGNLHGAIQKLKAMLNMLQNADVNDPTNPLNTVRADYIKVQKELTELATERKADKTPGNDEVVEFRNKCLEYSQAYLKLQIYNWLMSGNFDGQGGGNILDLMIEKLTSYNSETFEIYTAVLEEFSKTLSKDSDIIGHAERSYLKNGEVFGFDALGIATATAKKEQFEDLFEEYINPDIINDLALQFANSMFGQGTRTHWKGYTDDPEALADEVRRVFQNFFAPIVSNLLEKLLMLAYLPTDTAEKYTLERLNQIWDAVDEAHEVVPGDSVRRSNCIKQAGEGIANALKGQAKPLMRYEDDNLLDGQGGPDHKVYPFLYRFISDEKGTNLSELNQAIFDALGGDAKVGALAFVDSEAKSVMTLVDCIYPIALPLISGIKSSFAQYVSLKKPNSVLTTPGAHLDERSQNWVAFLPEVYGVDADRFYVAKGNPTVGISYDDNNDRKQLDWIKNDLEYAFEHQLIKVNTDPADGKVTGYELIIDIRSSDGFAAFEAEYKKTGNVIEALTNVNAADGYAVSFSLMEIKAGSAENASIIAEPENAADYSNLCRSVRNSMIYQRKLHETVDFCKNILQKHVQAVLNRIKYTERVHVFANMLLLNLLRYNEELNQWEYVNGYVQPEDEETQRYDFNSYGKMYRFSGIHRGLDKKAELYLLFTLGLMPMNDENYMALKYLSDVCIAHFELYHDKVKLGEWKQKIKLFLRDPNFMLQQPESTRFRNINESVSTSPHAEGYDYPEARDLENPIDPTVYNNINGFYNELLKYLDLD